jgi:KUP system potassium uptake protein
MAVTSTMLVTTILFYVVARQKWGWRQLTAGVLAGLFFLVDILLNDALRI